MRERAALTGCSPHGDAITHTPEYERTALQIGTAGLADARCPCGALTVANITREAALGSVVLDPISAITTVA